MTLGEFVEKHNGLVVVGGGSPWLVYNKEFYCILEGCTCGIAGRSSSIAYLRDEVIDYLPLDVVEGKSMLSVTTSIELCTCDFYSVVLRYGCQCGGK